MGLVKLRGNVSFEPYVLQPACRVVRLIMGVIGTFCCQGSKFGEFEHEKGVSLLLKFSEDEEIVFWGMMTDVVGLWQDAYGNLGVCKEGGTIMCAA